MKILNTKIHNILSIENADLAFEDNGLVLVEGWNYDAGRANGAGKTAIFNAICFALYGKVPRKINISEILRSGTKRGFAYVTVLVGNVQYSVKRERPNKVTFYVNGTETLMTQETFESYIKLGYEQFLVSMYTAQNANDKFIYKNDTNKKDFLLQLMNLQEFSTCKKETDSYIKNLDKEIADLKLNLTAYKSKIQVYQESIKDPELLKAANAAHNFTIQLHVDQIKLLEAVDKPDLSKYNDLEQNIRDKQNEFVELRTKRSMIAQNYRKIMAEDKPFVAKDPDATCPHCAEALNINGKSVVKADDKTAVKKQHEDHISKIRQEASVLKAALDDIDAKLLKEEEINKLAVKIREKKTTEYSEYDKAIRKIGDLKGIIERIKTTINTNDQQILQQAFQQGKIKDLTEQVIKIEQDIASKEVEVELLEAVAQLYSTTGAQAYIMDSVVDSFNEVVGKYVDMVWPNASYQLNSYKEKGDGDLVAKFSETLIISGKEYSIGSLSGGEQRALSLAVDFAIIDILSKQFGMPLNPIIMDEPFEGLDATGREIVIELLDKLAVDRQIWVVDHASEAKAMFSKTLKVEKKNGVSTIVV